MSSVLGSIFSAFFRSGQVLETFRGAGVYQEAVDVAIKRLDEGKWVSNLMLFYISSLLSMYSDRYTYLGKAKSINHTNMRPFEILEKYLRVRW